MARLAMVMIARNEAERIGRALRSVRPHVDAMVVLDTGSSDDTAAIAAECGAKVHSFDWCDDFAAARNAALALSGADWNLVLDADEWLEEPGEALGADAVAAWGAAPRFIGEVQILNHVMQGDTVGLSTTWLPRLLPRGVLYTGRIHEQPDAALPRTRLPVRISHDGYMPKNLARKAGRNEALLRRELEATPDDAYLWFQLGKEHQARDDAEEAAMCLSKAYNLCPAGAPFRHALIVRTISALKAARAFGDGRALADAEAPNWSDSADFWFVVGDLYLDWSSSNPEQAIKHGLPICEYAWKRCLEIGERDDLDGSVKGRGGFMAAYNLAIMFETFGMEEQAKTYHAMADELKRAA